LLLPVWLFARMALNAVDGMLAREHAQASRLGVYLNELADVLSDAALYAPFGLLPAIGPALAGLIVLLAVLTEFAGILGPMAGSTRRYDGPLGKSDRAFVFGAAGLWIGLGGALPAWTMWLALVVAALLAATVVNRIRTGLVEGGRGT
jgi:CDP-diacylglycerol--glycerol-3-phosphate 3-phosphatidyltransferase